MKFTTRKLTFCGMIAALYAVLVLVNAGFSFNEVQFRIAEVLTVLPFFFPETIFGLFIGCVTANIISPYGLLDAVLGSTATLIAAYLTSKMPTKWLAPLPPVIVNAVVIGAMLAFFVPGSEGTAIAFGAAAVSVGMPELVICAGLGLPLLLVIEKFKLREKFKL